MKRVLFYILLLTVFGSILAPTAIMAAKDCLDDTPKPCRDECISKDTLCLNLEYPEFGQFDLNTNQSLEGFIGWVYYTIIGISGLAAFIMLIWAGIQWMSSSGNPTKTSEAKERIKQALLGLLLVLTSFIIIQIINPELTILKDPLSGVSAPSSSGPQDSGE